MSGKQTRKLANMIAATSMLLLLNAGNILGQGIQRYAPKYVPHQSQQANPDDISIPLESPGNPAMKAVSPDERVLVESLDAIVIVDQMDKIKSDASLDELEGIHHEFEAEDSIVYGAAVQSLILPHLGQPITLKRLNTIAEQVTQEYKRQKMPIVDVQFPEQRITGGTVHIVVTESRIGKVVVNPGCYFACYEASRWVDCTREGDRIYEPNLESDLIWMNQNPFRRVNVDFKKGKLPGTTDVIYQVNDVRPVRGYIGIDDSGVEILNRVRYFTGFTHGNLFGQGEILGYQYTTDEDFSRLEAHSLSYLHPFSRNWSFQSYASWAGVTPALGFGLNQNGESWQVGASLKRHLIRTRRESANATFGFDFKSTDNNLEFAGFTIAASNADLIQIQLGMDYYRQGCCQDSYDLVALNTFIGPGGGMTGAHSAQAFNSIRSGTSPDYIYGKLFAESSCTACDTMQLVTRFTGQVASERLLFSETLGLGGYDSIRGFDQRSYNADHGWIANFELGPKTWRWGPDCEQRVLRTFAFLDLGNGYLEDPLPGEDATTMVASAGLGSRFQLGDRVIARLGYGFALKDFGVNQPDNRAHFSLTWVPGPRPSSKSHFKEIAEEHAPPQSDSSVD